jgi:serine/threonine protein kinase
VNPDDADPRRDDEVELSLVLEFLALLVADREAGIVRSAAEYARLHPGHEAAIVRAYERAAAQDPGEATDDGRRVGPYVLIRELGRGGQAVVWLARDERLSRNVALKIVPRSPLFEDFAPRFRREAMAASALEHPGICPIYDVGADDAVAWIAMRHVAGEPLSKRLASATAPFAPLAAAAIVERVARALHVAHEAGIVHRDVKPANVMLGDSGQPIVLDFGVALHEGGESLTLSGQIVGTPAYMAPEAIEPRGRRPDRRVDVFALGVVLYEMATLARPFEGRRAMRSRGRSSSRSRRTCVASRRGSRATSRS